MLPVYLATFLAGVSLWAPVEKLFMTEIGFTPALIGAMAAGYAAFVPLVEVPSGILADRSSRKLVLLGGYLALCASVVVAAASHSVVPYLLAALLLGGYFALQSGTVDSIAYDIVSEESTGRAGVLFATVLGRIRALESLALVGSALLGGVLAEVTSTRTTYVATVPFTAAAVLALLFLREPRLHRPDPDGPGVGLREQVRTTYRVLLGRRLLVDVVAAAVTTMMLVQVLIEFGQLWLIELHAHSAWYGPAFAGLTSALGLGSLLAGRLRLDRRAQLLPVLAVLVGAAVVLTVTRQVWAVICAQVLAALLLAALGIWLTAHLHDAIDSRVRAGVASGVGALTWLVFVPFSLAFGLVAQLAGVSAAAWLIVAGSVFAAAALLRGKPGTVAETPTAG